MMSEIKGSVRSDLLEVWLEFSVLNSYIRVDMIYLRSRNEMHVIIPTHLLSPEVGVAISWN